MANVRGANTLPEMRVRKALFAAGFRYRLHVKQLAGKPDIVLPRHGIAVFVHGCFWHSHGCRKSKRPSSNRGFWDNKLDRNAERDQENINALKKAGWRIFVIWECSLSSGIDEVLEYLTRDRLSSPDKMRSTARA